MRKKCSITAAVLCNAEAKPLPPPSSHTTHLSHAPSHFPDFLAVPRHLPTVQRSRQRFGTCKDFFPGDRPAVTRRPTLQCYPHALCWSGCQRLHRTCAPPRIAATVVGDNDGTREPSTPPCLPLLTLPTASTSSAWSTLRAE